VWFIVLIDYYSFFLKTNVLEIKIDVDRPATSHWQTLSHYVVKVPDIIHMSATSQYKVYKLS
jgi:hypothetical protein